MGREAAKQNKNGGGDRSMSYKFRLHVFGYVTSLETKKHHMNKMCNPRAHKLFFIFKRNCTVGKGWGVGGGL